jgi:hypothetical protein
MNKGSGQALYTLIGYALILLFLIVAALVLGAIMYLLVISAGGRPSHDSVVKWMGLVGFMIVAFGYAIRQCRRYWYRKVFWFAITSLLAIHLICFFVAFSFVAHWNMVWFFVVCTVEGPLIESLVSRIAGRHRV